MTGVQLALVLACQNAPGQFLLCGDSNQIVHAKFFSWSAVKTLFWQGLAGEAAQHQQLQVLQANFRNTQAVTALANTFLQIKQARFGSIDRESNFLVTSTSGEPGDVTLVQARQGALKQIDAATRASARHAVIVLRDEDKASARAQLHTPLIFSVHEAKGLEYPHVVLLGMVSGQRAAYAEVCDGVTPQDLQQSELDYRRAKDKSDKSLELFKFYVNALYVAMTRAVQSLTIVESDTGHPLFKLLGLQSGGASAGATPASTKEEWAQEARKLELQGKEEQARAIRETFLQGKPVPWTPWSRTLIEELVPKALDRSNPSARQKQTLMDYALWHGQQFWVEQLARANFQPARSLAPEGDFGWIGGAAVLRLQLPAQEQHQQLALRAVSALRQRHLQQYAVKNFKDLLRLCDAHTVDHLAGGCHAPDAGRACGEYGAGRCPAGAGCRPERGRRLRTDRVAAGGEPGDRRARIRQGFTGPDLRPPGAGSRGRAGRWLTRAHRATSGRIPGAELDAGGLQDPVVLLHSAQVAAVEVRRRLLRGSVAPGARIAACTSVA